jgi:CheY-like chemotaxis protein
MFGKTPKTASVPLSEYTNRELRRGAAELRQVAATASTDACKQALETLGAHFDALVEQREAEDHEAYRAAVAFALRLTGAEQSEAEKHTAMLGPDRMSQPPFSRQALQFATDAICRQNVLSETRQHPVIQNASLKLVHLLTAYDLLPAEQTFGKARSDIPEKRRNEGNFDGAHPTGHHILVVDDVADVLVTVGAFLTNAGFTVQKASNGDEALRLIARNPQIDVLVTDFAMPGLSGVDLIAQAMQLRPNLKSLLITGYPNADGLAVLPPYTTILTKPFRRSALLAEVRFLLGESSPTANATIELSSQEKI